VETPEVAWSSPASNPHLGANVKKGKYVLASPGHNIYLREQEAAAKAVANRLGVELQVVNAEMDPVLQSQQLLGFVQARAESRPDGILLEPVNANGLPSVAEAAVAAGIGWVLSNAQVEYIRALRQKARAPVFQVSQDHLEVGRIQGRQIGTILPRGGSVLYLRGPSMNSLASRRFEGLESAKPQNVEVKSLKIQATAESSYNAVCSWLGLSTVRPEGIQMIVAQNADFILGAKKAFETSTSEPERAKWLALPCACGGPPNQIKPLVDQGVLRAAVVTPLTMDKALEMLVGAVKGGSQPQEETFVEAHSYGI
jgi:ABC-type sugar transport system substrate-binding protein